MSKSFKDLLEDKEFIMFLVTFFFMLLIVACAIEYLRIFGILPSRYMEPLNLSQYDALIERLINIQK